MLSSQSTETIDKLMGDAVMAFWGDPKPLSDHASRGCRCALKMMNELNVMKKETGIEALKGIDIGIGLSTGPMQVGHLGSESFSQYTVLGDTVNLGARLEGQNKTYGTNIIVSEEVFLATRNEFEYRELDLLMVKGKSVPVHIYELVAEKDEISDDTIESVRIYEKGLALFRNRDFEKAEECFYSVIDLMGEDEASTRLIDLTREIPKEPTGE